MRSASFVSVCAFLLAGSAAAQVTTAHLFIGGPGSCDDSSFNDPGRLDDGVTQGTARFDFTLNGATNELSLVVRNTSPVVPGVCNPILTTVWFTASPLLDRALIPLGTSGGGGAAVSWIFRWDRDLTDGSLNFAEGFGLLNGQARSRFGVEGGIANTAADTHVASLSNFVHDWIEFRFLVNGPLIGTNFTATDFVDFFSLPGMGQKPVHAVARFQGGGGSCGSVGNISDGFQEDCYIVRADATGTSTFLAPDPNLYPFSTQLASARDYFGVTMEGPLYLPLARSKKVIASLNRTLVDDFYVQLVMWNPTVFPANPEQHSAGWRVRLWDDGTYKLTPFGFEDGMTLEVEQVQSWRGTRFLHFPFSIEGF